VPSYILTGAPGAGKTAVLRLLETAGYPVVEEAATDVIALGNALGRAEPWHDHDFIDKVIILQRQRQDSLRAAGGPAVFFDRSPVCTLALSRFLGCATSRLLASAVRQIGFQLVEVPAGPLADRVALIRQTVGQQQRPD
jgi:predicted ATPase